MDYLHECFELAGRVRKEFYPDFTDLDELEKIGAQIRSSRRLTYEDAGRILMPNAQFWVMPGKPEFEGQIEKGEIDLWNLPRKEEEVVTALLLTFRHIGPVSALLRFLHPEGYGIFSAPVVEILETRRQLSFKGALHSIPDMYIGYLHNLRDLRDRRGFERVADVETALWALYEGVLRRQLPGCEHLEKAFYEDAEVRAIRVRNLVDDLLNSTQQRDLAEALIEVDVLRSAQFAGLEFERRVREYAEKADPEYNDEHCLYDVIRQLSDKRILDSTVAGFWHKARKVRNRAAHGRKPQDVDVRFLLETLDKVV
jgi:hypothetical protein